LLITAPLPSPHPCPRRTLFLASHSPCPHCHPCLRCCLPCRPCRPCLTAPSLLPLFLSPYPHSCHPRPCSLL
jgi:hypothetical protein